jgi:hypothetical protein
MTATSCALLGFIAWSILLTLALIGVRTAATLKGKALNTFSATGADLDDFGLRVTRAHGNSVENLAIVACLLLYAISTDQTAITNGLAAVVFGARVVQSVVHIASGSVPAVVLRATAFTVQNVIGLMWIWQFYHAASPA